MPATREGGWALWGPSGEIRTGTIVFDPKKAEAEGLRQLATILDRHRPYLVILERPFLFAIARNIGAVQMWCAVHHVAWWMIGASRAKKLALGRGNASKAEVKTWAEARLSRRLSQHESDALLYLVTWQLSQGGEKG